jgi:uncharacterized protein
MRIAVTGSHGLVGSALVAELERKGHHVLRLVRKAARTDNEVQWDPMTAVMREGAIEGYDALIHLGGVSIGEQRWTPRQRRRIWESRVFSTDVLAQRLEQLVARPRVFICASAVGYYGDRGDEEITEATPAGEGFLADLCKEWEAAVEPAKRAGIRTVNLRSGVVLHPDGGALARQLPIFRLCMGGRMGDGRQYMSWISLRDEVRAIIHLLEHDNLEGGFNLVAPDPLQNALYTKLLAAILRRPSLFPSPRWLLSLALGKGVTDEMLLASQRAYPARLHESGFEFQDNEIDTYLQELFPPHTRKNDAAGTDASVADESSAGSEPNDEIESNQ